MSCKKNPKEVLGIKILGNHNWIPQYIDKFSENLYRLTEYCTVCGEARELIRRHYELIKIGFTEDQIKKAGYYHKTEIQRNDSVL